MPSARSEARSTARSCPASLARSFVTRKTSSRGSPLSRSARPTSASLAYMVAVSTWRYPACSARPTATAALCPRIGHVPNPTMGMVTPWASVTDGTSRASVIRPFSAIRAHHQCTICTHLG